MKEHNSPKLQAYFLRNYCRKSPYQTLIEPVFITWKRNAVVYFGSRFRENLKLCRRLKNDGYTLTLRKRRIPTFKVRSKETGEVLEFSWRARRIECFARWWWN